MRDGAPSGVAYPIAEPPAPGAAIEVAPGVLWMRLPLPLRLNHVNVYALDEGDSWTVIDTGMASKTSKAVWRDLLAGPLRGKPVARVLVTHHHPDHVGLAGWFQQEFGAALLTSQASWLMTRMLVLDEQPVPTQDSLDFARRAGVSEAWLAEKATARPFNLCDFCVPLAPSYTRVTEGTALTLGGRIWDVHFGEGHAPEQITLWARDTPLVIGADQFLPTITPVLGVYPSEPEADPLQDYFDTLATARPLARDDHLVLPGHKLPFTGLPQRIDALAAEHRENLDKLVTLLAVPHVATDCFGVLFRSKIDADNFNLALSETMACLNHLLGQGRVTRRLSDSGAWLWRAKG